MPVKYTNEILEQAYDLIVNKRYSANKASKELGIDNGTMRKRLKEKYGQIFLPSGKKQIDSTFFNTIDTEEKAYWLGFFTADGYVKGNNIELCLAEKDKTHIEAFKKAVNSQHTISKKTTVLNDKTFVAYRISVKDNELASALQSYGLTNNKSYDAFIPSEHQIPKHLFRHYIRGMFDGDGSIYNGANGINISFVTGSEKMYKDFSYTIENHINIKMIGRTTRNIFELRLFSKKDVYKFLSWIYDDSTIYLKRKYNKFKYAVLGQKSQKS